MKIEEVEVTKRVMTKTLFKFMANPRKSNESLTDSLHYNLFQGLTGISVGLNQDASFLFRYLRIQNRVFRQRMLLQFT